MIESSNKNRYLEKVKKISNEAKKEELYPVCPLLSSGNRHRRCIGSECIAYKAGYEGFCNALHAKIKVILI